MAVTNRLYFRQLLAGRDYARHYVFRPRNVEEWLSLFGR
jgi:hypothetical protein